MNDFKQYFKSKPSVKALMIVITLEFIGFCIYTFFFSGWGSTTSILNCMITAIAGMLLILPPDIKNRFYVARWLKSRHVLGLVGALILLILVGAGNVFNPSAPKWLVLIFGLLPSVKMILIFWITGNAIIRTFEGSGGLTKATGTIASLAAILFLLFTDSIQRVLLPNIYPINEFITFTHLVILLMAALAARGLIKLASDRPWADILIFFIIWVIAALIWTSLPNGALTSMNPGVDPNFQYIPSKDAFLYDYSAAKIALGRAGNIRLGSYANLVYLWAMAKLFIGFETKSLIIFQTAFLGIIPALLYLIGKRVGSRSIGLIASGLYITSMANLIISPKSDVNIGFFQTEPLMTLGMVLITFVLIELFKSERQIKDFLVYGAVVGFISLVRVNALPFLAVPSLLLFRFDRKIIWRAVLVGFVVTAGAALVLLPFTIRNVAADIDPIYFSGKLNALAKRITNNPEMKLSKIRDYKDTVPEPDSQKSVPDFSFDAELTRKRLFPIVTYDFMLLPRFINDPAIRANSNLRDYPILDLLNFDVEAFNGLTFVVNILFVTIGGLWFVRKKNWVGLIPMLIYLLYLPTVVYSSTLVPRHVFPINWIPMFYLAAALVSFVKDWNSDVKDWNSELNLQMNLLSETTSKPRPPWYTQIVLIVMIGAVFPIMEALIPAKEFTLFQAGVENSSGIELTEKASQALQGYGVDPAQIESLLAEDENASLSEGILIYPIIGLDINSIGKTPLPDDKLNMFVLIHSGNRKIFRVASDQPATIFSGGDEVWVLTCPDPLRKGQALALLTISVDGLKVVPEEPTSVPNQCPTE